MVVKLAQEAEENGHNYLTRARLMTENDSPFDKDRLVADFVDLTSGEVVEVAWSEGEKSLADKKRIYEKYGLPMISIRVKKD